MEQIEGQRLPLRPRPVGHVNVNQRALVYYESERKRVALAFIMRSCIHAVP